MTTFSDSVYQLHTEPRPPKEEFWQKYIEDAVVDTRLFAQHLCDVLQESSRVEITYDHVMRAFKFAIHAGVWLPGIGRHEWRFSMTPLEIASDMKGFDDKMNRLELMMAGTLSGVSYGDEKSIISRRN